MTTWIRLALAQRGQLGRLHIFDHHEPAVDATQRDVWVTICGNRIPSWLVDGEWERDEIPPDACGRCVPPAQRS